MSLEKYREKRKFDKTPEPVGGKSKRDNLEFVIQKHQASHLHYDFRLEIRGVLKSWAVPKGPSMDPSVKRLAMLVEDHPFDYKNFEGIIPKGNYGAGTVIIWDQGTYEPIELFKDKAAKEKNLLQQFHSGKMQIVLKGKKLKGTFNLVRVAGRGENAWLLSKSKDKYATKSDISKKDRSVVSGKTIETMSIDPKAAEWQSNRKSVVKQKLPAGGSLKITKGIKQQMPKSLDPMLCTLTKTATDNADFLHEIKWDGYRIISYVNGNKVRMDSRGGKDYTKRYPPVAAALKQLGHDAVLDGEVVVFNDRGLPDFDALQLYNGHNTPISYCLFDIVWLDGYDLKHLPLTERKEILRDLIESSEVLKFSESFDDGPSLYQHAIELNLEGIVSKKRDSPYVPGERANKWLKIPTRVRQEFVIGGWAESERGRSFRSLLFGAYRKDGKLEWIGRSGGGYKDKEMPGILKKLRSIETDKSPFVNKILDTKGAVIHYTKPMLVANFEFATWTKSGRIRKPATFLGFRQDKKPKDVVRERPKSTGLDNDKSSKDTPVKKQMAPASKESNWHVIEKIKPKAVEEFEFGECKVELTDVDRNIWKGIPKAKLIEYYHSVSKIILPHLKERPLSLHIKPYGATEPGLYIKDMEGRQPGCAEIFTDTRRHAKQGKRSQIDYLVCNNEATLLYIINLGCIDINPWMSQRTNPTKPNYINIDLDPSDDDFGKAIEVALAAKDVLKRIPLQSFIKTSGKTGLHIYIPVEGIEFAEARKYSEHLGRLIHEQVPAISTTNINIKSRGNKLFIDPSQNDYADTLASAYSVRPYHLPTVSTPLEWKEVNSKLDPHAFNMDTILKRIRSKGDLFTGVLKKQVALKNARLLKRL